MVSLTAFDLHANLTRFIAALPPQAGLIFDIGSNTDPLVTSDTAGNPRNMATVAFEPIVPHLIGDTSRPILRRALDTGRLHIIPAAVSSADGISHMLRMGGRTGRNFAASSSLLAPAESGATWSKGAESTLVPVMSLSKILARTVPRRQPQAQRDLVLLKTDLQGHDCEAVASVAPRALLRRAHYVQMEVALYGVSSYTGARATDECARNQFCEGVLPLMTSAGFRLLALTTNARTRKQKLLAYSTSSAQEACKYPDGKLRSAALPALNASLGGKFMLGHHNEANAFFRRNDTHLTKPKVKDWA